MSLVPFSPLLPVCILARRLHFEREGKVLVVSGDTALVQTALLNLGAERQSQQSTRWIFRNCKHRKLHTNLIDVLQARYAKTLQQERQERQEQQEQQEQQTRQRIPRVSLPSWAVWSLQPHDLTTLRKNHAAYVHGCLHAEPHRFVSGPGARCFRCGTFVFAQPVRTPQALITGCASCSASFCD